MASSIEASETMLSKKQPEGPRRLRARGVDPQMDPDLFHVLHILAWQSKSLNSFHSSEKLLFSLDSDYPRKSWKQAVVCSLLKLICCPAEAHALREDMQRVVDFSADSAEHCMAHNQPEESCSHMSVYARTIFVLRKAWLVAKGGRSHATVNKLLFIFSFRPWIAYLKSTDSLKMVLAPFNHFSTKPFSKDANKPQNSKC